jgi:DNA-binding response OmpR family regulator
VTRIVVAHESEAIREAALRVVREAGWEGIAVADGDSAHALIVSPPPAAALVVDVGLPKRLGYELVDDIRVRGLSTRVVLIASVYSKTAYKRAPTRLYGADDYVEQHHIPDKLHEKLAKLLPSPNPPVARDVHSWAQLTPEERKEVEQIRRAGEARLDLGDLPRDEAIARARRVARLIVADVVLYASAGDASRLTADLAAARELFAQRMPPELAAGQDFIGEAYGAYVASKDAGGRSE